MKGISMESSPAALPDLPEHLRQSVYNILKMGCSGEPNIYYSFPKKKNKQLKTSELKNYFDGVHIV